MKYIYLLLISTFSLAQVPAYYSSIDFTQPPTNVKQQLTSLITSTHTNPTSYGELWEVLKETDQDPDNTNNVILVYGYNDTDGNVVTDRSRNKNNNGGGVGQWNREHVYPKSLGTPDLGSSGPGSDAHMLRPSDVQQNGNRGNKQFANGSGNAGSVSTGWYPGDEWKGDVARIIMYMYVRYTTRCLPNNVGAGSNSYHADMPDIFLQWNADDPVSDFEMNRNNILNTTQGNRNPFIDNPYLATFIWGGPDTEDTWGILSVEDIVTNTQKINIYPNPVQEELHISESFKIAEIISTEGKIIQTFTSKTLNVSHLEKGIYLLSITTLDNETEVLKFIKK